MSTTALFVDGPANGMVTVLQGEPRDWEVMVPTRSVFANVSDPDPYAPSFARCRYTRLPPIDMPGFHRDRIGGSVTTSGYAIYVWDGRRAH